MSSPKCVVVFLLLAFIALPCAAEDEENPTIPVDAIKFIAEQSISRIAELGYNQNCKAKNLDYASDDSWYCGLFAALSGAKKQEWKERLDHRLGKIEGYVKAINAAVAEIQSKQDSLYRLNEQILIRMNEIGPETIVGKNITRIRVEGGGEPSR